MLNCVLSCGLVAAGWLAGYVTRALLERADAGVPAPPPIPPAGPAPVLYGRPNVAAAPARYLVWDREARTHVVREVVWP